MSENNEKAMEQLAMALYYSAATMMKDGKSHEEIVQWLIQKGVKPDTAERMMVKLQQSRVNVTRRSGQRKVVAGILLCGIGLILTTGIVFPDITEIGRLLAALSILPGGYLLLRGIQQIIVR